MTKDEIDIIDLYRIILPNEIVEYFDIISIRTVLRDVHIYLDEKDSPPVGNSKKDVLSKGFHKVSTIQDFPIRNKASYLHVRRRRWMVKSTGKVISRDWQSVAKGTQLTTDFATFLKGAFGFVPNKQ